MQKLPAGPLIGLAVVVIGIAFTVYYLVFGVPQKPIEGIGGGSYSLVDHRGQPIDETMLTGHPSLLYFGFTRCPDVCPTTMAEMQHWFAELGAGAGRLSGYFVSIDPQRDTPDLMAGYVEWVSPRMTGVTGTQAEIDRIVAAWHVYAARVPTSDGDYTMNHTASVFLVDSAGRFVGTIAYGEASDTALQKIRRLIAEDRG